MLKKITNTRVITNLCGAVGARYIYDGTLYRYRYGINFKEQKKIIMTISKNLDHCECNRQCYDILFSQTHDLVNIFFNVTKFS